MLYNTLAKVVVADSLHAPEGAKSTKMEADKKI
jgi:hypothetical protein